MCGGEQHEGSPTGETLPYAATDVPFPWHLSVYDAHCHPTDHHASIATIPSMKTKCLTIMATREEDQLLVENAAIEYGVKTVPRTHQDEIDGSIIPCFGWHPWFSHLMLNDIDDLSQPLRDYISTIEERKVTHYQTVLTPQPDLEFVKALPMPSSLKEFLNESRKRLQHHRIALVGEIGIDRSFRLPEPWTEEELRVRDTAVTPGSREGRRLSPYRVTMAHQRDILQAQLRLAGEMGRAVSVHGVQAHGAVFDALRDTWKGYELQSLSKKSRRKIEQECKEEGQMESKTTASTKPYPPRICLHSYSGPVAPVKQYLHPSIPAEVYFSFSMVINLSSPSGKKAMEVIEEVPDNRLLVETDLDSAGDRLDGYMEEIVRVVCRVKRWDLEEGIQQLGRNWRDFVFGVGNIISNDGNNRT